MTSLPLLDEILRAEPPRRGPRSQRPLGVDATTWSNWRREVSQRGARDSLDAFWHWLPGHLRRRAALRRRSAVAGPREPEAVWTTVVWRRDLSPALEADYRARIARGDLPGVWRISLLGIQRRDWR